MANKDSLFYRTYNVACDMFSIFLTLILVCVTVYIIIMILSITMIGLIYSVENTITYILGKDAFKYVDSRAKSNMNNYSSIEPNHPEYIYQL